MKKFFVAASCFCASAALACPNLAGKYSPKAGGELAITIDQKEVQGATVYTFTPEKPKKLFSQIPYFKNVNLGEIIADGKPHEVPVQKGQPYTYTAACVEGALTIAAEAVTDHHGEAVKVHATGSFAMKAQDKLFVELAARGDRTESYALFGFGHPLYKLQ